MFRDFRALFNKLGLKYVGIPIVILGFLSLLLSNNISEKTFLFCLKSNKEICRGGRYLTSNSENAVGSTFFLNQFANVSEEKDLNNKKIVFFYSNNFSLFLS